MHLRKMYLRLRDSAKLSSTIMISRISSNPLAMRMIVDDSKGAKKLLNYHRKKIKKKWPPSQPIIIQ